jgi:hypothetical protein
MKGGHETGFLGRRMNLRGGVYVQRFCGWERGMSDFAGRHAAEAGGSIRIPRQNLKEFL